MLILADSQPIWVNLMPVVGVLLILIGLVMFGRKRMAARAARQQGGVPRRPSDVADTGDGVGGGGGGGGGAREQLERARQKQAMRGDLDQVMVEIEQLAKRFGAQLDAKTIALERLIRQADGRIDELKRLHEAGPSRDGVNNDASADAPRRPAPRADTPHHAPDPHHGTVGEDDALRRDVYNLADQGLAPPQIARRLDEHVGKVELMLALRRA